MNFKETYKEIQKASKYQYFDICYWVNDWSCEVATCKFIDFDSEQEAFIVVGSTNWAKKIDLAKIRYIAEPNPIALKYELKKEYLQHRGIVARCEQNDDDHSNTYFENKGIASYLYNALKQVMRADDNQVCKFLEA